jgi:hypothetical protein
MTDTIEHPMRNAPIHVFQRVDNDGTGATFIARLHPYDTYPVFWHGKTAEAAKQSCADFVAEAVAKHEAAYVTRQENAQKARAAAKAKKETA